MTPARLFPTRCARLRAAPERSQRGVVLFIALIVLVAMTLAGLATMRASGGAVLTAGNLAFRQNATVAGDRGVEAAMTWLRTQSQDALANTNAGKGYYATFNAQLPTLPPNEEFDPMLWGKDNWEKPDRAVLVGTDAAGNTVRFVIHRLCAVTGVVSGPGKPANQACVTATAPTEGQSKSAPEPGSYRGEKTALAFYRITSRIDGPKNTVSIVQVMVY